LSKKPVRKKRTDAGYWMRDVGCGMWDVGCGILTYEIKNVIL
jgi:hypothetical protein